MEVENGHLDDPFLNTKQVMLILSRSVKGKPPTTNTTLMESWSPTMEGRL